MYIFFHFHFKIVFQIFATTFVKNNNKKTLQTFIFFALFIFRMQIEMLKNQTQLNQKDLLVLESQAPPPPRSRFDQQFRPGRQSQLAQPGTIAIFFVK